MNFWAHMFLLTWHGHHNLITDFTRQNIEHLLKNQVVTSHKEHPKNQTFISQRPQIMTIYWFISLFILIGGRPHTFLRIAGKGRNLLRNTEPETHFEIKNKFHAHQINRIASKNYTE